ncbi:red chlorophyll catabolite reductase [Fischerella thermalis CCMEE 5268]|uniref:Red chlorophyll catabolite reductase n=1 Tax=Fischerella thermalis CCMEE 5268 TaxID=2019662 RepID=A0A2N6KE85_9CYAN|nr:red chlorophyll catabolite reductase [Fischerella thermalis]PLZ97266.1 red chlorophyll catabolite reductase [Fischerella thermalis CCMEE 5268]
MDCWLNWVDRSEKPVAAEEQPVLAARDLFKRDLGNQLAVQLTN